jgi:sirohydrochlorin ferrochelatase
MERSRKVFVVPAVLRLLMSLDSLAQARNDPSLPIYLEATDMDLLFGPGAGTGAREEDTTAYGVVVYGEQRDMQRQKVILCT